MTRGGMVLLGMAALVLAAVFGPAVHDALSTGAEPGTAGSAWTDSQAPAGTGGCGSGAGCGASGSCGSLSAGAAGGGCCSASSAAGPQSAVSRAESIQRYLTDYFARKLGDPGIVVEVKDFGCHQEATVLRDGRVWKRLSISGGRITEMAG